MAEASRIPIPWRQRWMWIRFQILPIGFFSVCLVLTGILWTKHAGTPSAVGEVFGKRIDLASRIEGTLIEGPRKLELFSTVRAGEVVARLDDGPLLALLGTLQAEVGEAQGQLESVVEEARLGQLERLQDKATEVNRRIVRLEEARMAALALRTQVLTDKVELQRFTKNYEASKQAYERRAMTVLQLIEAKYNKDLVAERLARNEEALKEAQEQIKGATERVNDYPEVEAPDTNKLLAPIRAAIATKEAAVREIEVQLQSLEIRAPIDGVVATIWRWPGQTVAVGEPILTVAAEKGEYVVSYMRQGRVQPEPGMAVDVRLRTIPAETIYGYVDQVGPQVELIPPHQLRDPKLMEWGLPVRIAIPEGVKLRPGELVDVRFKSGAPPKSESSSSAPRDEYTQQRGT